jgi:glucosamine kinase
MHFYLGIDGGGSKTDCLVGDDVRMLGRALGPSCKVQRVGEEQARAALHTVITEACVAAEIEPARIERACIGIAGFSLTGIERKIRTIIGELVRGEIHVVGDNTIALQAACGGLPGAVVIAGTGSIAYGRSEQGKEARAGGWGPAISDEGSGGWIGRRAVAQVMRARDRGKDPQLLFSLLQALHANGTDDLVRIANETPPPDFAALLPRIIQACSSGDALACDILMAAGGELARLASTVIRQLWADDERNVRVGMAGGVFAHSAVVRRSFFNLLRAERPRIAMNFAVAEPVHGAFELARSTAAVTAVR